MMNRILVLIAVGLMLAACRSTGAGRALPTQPGMDLGHHRLVGCEEKVRGPVNPVLKRYVGQSPMAYVSWNPGCEELKNCRRQYAFAVFPDGLLVYEGTACGRRSVQGMLRQLDAGKIAAARGRVEKCSSLLTSEYWCSHGDRLFVECRTASGSVHAVDQCDREENALHRFATGLGQALDLENTISAPKSCERDDAGFAIGELGLTVHPARKMECTYVPK
jgi:hypothetical protein